MHKDIFRRMKKLMSIVEKHANNYYRELEALWQETDLSEVETLAVLDCMQNILNQLPQAVYQAHERLIGERRVANKDKILSIYEPDVHVLIRGKADDEIEFGNGLYLAEQADGLIVDWTLIKEQPPSKYIAYIDCRKPLQVATIFEVLRFNNMYYIRKILWHKIC